MNRVASEPVCRRKLLKPVTEDTPLIFRFAPLLYDTPVVIPKLCLAPFLNNVSKWILLLQQFCQPGTPTCSLGVA